MSGGPPKPPSHLPLVGPGQAPPSPQGDGWIRTCAIIGLLTGKSSWQTKPACVILILVAPKKRLSPLASPVPACAHSLWEAGSHLCPGYDHVDETKAFNPIKVFKSH